MNVPLLDLHAQLKTIQPELLSALKEVVVSCQFVNGPQIAKLEASIADYVGVDHGIGVSSGTDALLMGLMALDVGQGDLVLTTPYSFFATAGAIARLGATPVFVDIEPDTYNICPQKLGQWFSENTKKIGSVKAIIPVHLYGQCADMAPIMALAEEHKIAVIEDAAQAIGSTYNFGATKKHAGSIGDIGCFSFFPSKNLGGLGDGGMVVTNDEELAVKLRKLRNHGSSPKYYHELIGGNFRLDTLQAAALAVKLPHLESWHQARQEHAAYYDEQLAQIPELRIPKLAQSRNCHIYNQYVLQAERRDLLRDHLKANNIGTEVYYPVPFHEQVCFANLGYQLGDFPVAETAARSTLAIPVYPELDREMQDYVVSVIKDFYG